MRGTWFLSSSGAQIVNAMTGMATNLPYARQLSLAEVGGIALINSLAMIGAVFLDRGMGSWLTRSIAAGESTMRGSFKHVLRAALPGTLIGTAVSVAAMIHLADSYNLALVVSVASLPLCIAFWWFQVGISFTQGLNLSTWRSLGIALNGILTLIGTFVILVSGGGILLAISASAIAYVIVGTILVHKCSRSAPTRHHQPSNLILESRSTTIILREALPLFGTNLVTFAISIGDVLLASIFLSTEQLGRYQIAKKIAQAFTLPFIATLPMALGRFTSRPARDRVSGSARLFVLSCAVLAICMLLSGALLPSLIPFFFGNSYGGLQEVVSCLLLGFSLQYARDLMNVVSVASGSFTRPLVVGLLTASVFCAGVFLLAERLSLFNLSLTVVVAYGTGFAYQLLLVNLRREWKVKDVVMMIGATSALFACTLLAISSSHFV